MRPGKKNPDNLKEVELGYRLKKKFWGQGMATEGSRALIDHAFHHLDVENIWAYTLKINLGSQAVMKKLGMTFTAEYIEEDLPVEDKTVVRYDLKSSVKK